MVINKLIWDIEPTSKRFHLTRLQLLIVASALATSFNVNDTQECKGKNADSHKDKTQQVTTDEKLNIELIYDFI